MLLLLVLILCATLPGFFGKPRQLAKRVDGILPREVTSCVNGLFIALVFVSHGSQYVPDGALSQLDVLYSRTVLRLGQLVVTTFLFYSGYGAMQSIRTKEGYAGRMPVSRILPFLLDVAIALVPYVALLVVRGNPPTVNELLLALVGRKSLGNSNWYVFAILCMWVATWIAFRVARTHWAGVSLVAVAAALYAAVLWHDAPATKWWYNTIFCYPAGMAFALVASRGGGRGPALRTRVAMGVLGVVAFSLTFVIREPYPLVHNVRAIAFALVVTAVALGLHWVSRPLVWAGENLFFIYFYQRFFMMLLKPLVVPFGSFCFLVCSAVALVAWCPVAARVHAAARAALFGTGAARASGRSDRVPG